MIKFLVNTKFLVNITFIFFASTMLMPTPNVTAQSNHEYAPLQEKTITYKDWTFKNLKDGASVNLRQQVQSKKLVLVVYFSSWCPNWHSEAPVVARL